MAVDIEAYRSDLQSASDEVIGLHHLRYVWKNLVEMFKTKPELSHHGLVDGWLITCYSRTLAIGIRRQSDDRGSRPTIGSLLRRVKAHAAEFTRESCDFGAIDGWSYDADGWLAYAAAVEDALDADRVAEVIAKLSQGSEVARQWTNRRVAHLDRRDAPDATFDDLDAALVVLGESTNFLNGLLECGMHMPFFTPLAVPEWLSMFAEPWYDPTRMTHVDPMTLG